MAKHPDDTVVAAEAPDELIGAVWIAELRANGIEAQMAGGLTSGMRAEAPGGVNILVHKADAERARELIDHHENNRSDEA